MLSIPKARVSAPARAILNAEWVDHSATSDQISADDFELGTNYWSTTVP